MPEQVNSDPKRAATFSNYNIQIEPTLHLELPLCGGMQIPTIWPLMPPNLASDIDDELIESKEGVDDSRC